MAATRNIIFYPEHPSDAKTHMIETTEMPVLEQEKPFEIKAFCKEFEDNAENFFSKYVDKRFVVKGVAKQIGLDAHNKPSIQISDCIDGQTYALLIFQTEDHYTKVQVGDTVTVRANYLVMSNLLGVVMKHSELLEIGTFNM